MSDPLFSRQSLSEYLSKPERSLREDRRKNKVANYRVQSDESQIKKMKMLIDQNLAKKKKAVFFVMAVTTWARARHITIWW